MPVEYKDYYEVLQVSRSANGDEIRRAFRSLARVHHPDVAVNKEQAEVRFKEIIEAYEVLSDPEKRQTYDGVGRGWAPSSESQTDPEWRATAYTQQGASFEFRFGNTGFSEFFESLFGRRVRRRPLLDPPRRRRLKKSCAETMWNPSSLFRYRKWRTARFVK